MGQTKLNRGTHMQKMGYRVLLPFFSFSGNVTDNMLELWP